MRAFRLCVFSLVCLSCPAVVFAQATAAGDAAPQAGSSGAVSPQPATGQPVSSPAIAGQPVSGSAAATDHSIHDHSIHLDISVLSEAGQPAPALTESDLTVLDNSHPQPLTSFRAVGTGQEPAEMIFVMDAANTRHTNVAYQQTELQSFLRAAGSMPHPATIAVLTDKGIEILPGFSRDGAVLAKTLDNYTAALRTLTQSAGYWGATERLELSLKAMSQLTAYAKTLPGRKFIFWISPGWPLLSGPRIDLDTKQQDRIFDEIVSFSDQMRTARITVYDVDPFGLQQSLMAASYYKNFVKGVRKAKDTQIANLGLQVLAVQSGGRTVTTDNDIAQALKQCMTETESWYEAVFPMPPAEGPNEYHHLEVRVAAKQASVTARTRDGYYAQPLSAAAGQR